jgi:hypothetical protein
MLRCCHVADEYRSHTPRVLKDKVCVHFQVGLSAVSNEDEVAVWEVSSNLVQCDLFALGYGLEDTLKHTTILFKVEGARWQPSQCKVFRYDRV